MPRSSDLEVNRGDSCDNLDDLDLQLSACSALSLTSNSLYTNNSDDDDDEEDPLLHPSRFRVNGRSLRLVIQLEEDSKMESSPLQS